MVCPGSAGNNPDAAYHVADQGIRPSLPQISRCAGGARSTMALAWVFGVAGLKDL
jgi:hypothetical protein